MRRWFFAAGTGVALLALSLGSPAGAAEKGDGAIPSVPVVVTKYRGAPRLVFQWKRHVEFELVEHGQDWRVRFDRKAPIETKRLLREARSFKPRVVEDGEGVAVALHVPEGMRLQGVKSGASVVIDVVPAPPRSAKHEAESEPEKKGAEKAADAKSAEKKSAEKPRTGDLSVPGETTRAAVPEHAAADPALRARYVAASDGGTLRFEWAKPVGAAVWRRGDRVWILFDTPARPDLGDIRRDGRAAIPAIEQVDNARATVLRVATLAGFSPAVSRDGNAWVVDFRPEPAKVDQPLTVVTEAAAKPARVVFQMRGPGAVLPVADPDLGDTLLVVPTTEAGQAIGRAQSFVDFRALASVQGLVVQPVSDGLQLRPAADRVEATTPEGLVLSADADRVARARQDPQARLFDFAGWGAAPAPYREKRVALQRAVAAAAPEQRTATRLTLARFYFAEGFGAEALGVLDAVQREDPVAAATAGFHALRGAAAVLAGERDLAAKDLQSRALDGEPEATLWRAVLAAQNGDWAGAAKGFGATAPLLAGYPKKLRDRFALLAGEAFVATGSLDQARPVTELVLHDQPAPADLAAARFLAAKQLLLVGDVEAAINIWEELAKGDDRPTRARAAFERTNAMLASGRMARRDALEALENLRYAWRGDDFEVSLMRRIAELRLAEGDFRGGIEAMRQVVANFPDHPASKEVGKQIADQLAGFFTGKGLESLPPPKALALYQENRDLLPKGEQGNDIVRRLADRLVAVDLLDPAADLLEGQVAQASGAEKARTGTQLALLRLADRKPEAALKALDDSGKEVPPELVAQRRQLRARSLAELGRSEEAIAALAGDASRDTEKLRAAIHWRAQHWGEAAKVLAGLAGAPKDGTLDDEGSRIVLQWATALTLAGDQNGLAALRQKYAAAMEKGPNRDAFRVIAGDVAGGGDVREVAAKIAQVSDLQNFMSGYKKLVAGRKMSAGS